MKLFGRSAAPKSNAGSPKPAAPPAGVGARYGFGYLGPKEVYLDSACQTLRPQPVLDALMDHYHHYSACGERVKYPWGLRVDEEVAATRQAVLTALGYSAKTHTTSFTLNTTYGINLLLNQLPVGRYQRVVTTHTEHNSVFLPTIAFARSRGVPRTLLPHGPEGALEYSDADLSGALVVVSAMNNVNAAPVTNLPALVADVRRLGGTTIIDAAQAMPHAPALLHGLGADAICFSAHKVYGASLGVVAATNHLLDTLDLTFVGGGQVSAVTADGYTLLPDHHTKLEAGLQAWGEIVALRAALTWVGGFQAANGEALPAREARLGAALFDGLITQPKLKMLSSRGSSLVTVLPTDGHRLAAFLAKAGIMVRSGYFCAHHWLQEQCGYGPLVRFSLGAHNTEEDVSRTLEMVGRVIKGL